MRNLSLRRIHWMRLRIIFLGTLVAASAVAVLVRAWDLQVARSEVLRRMAEEQYMRDVRLAPKRGTIYDRHGSELAVSVDVDSVWANPRAMRKAGMRPERAVRALAEQLSIDSEVVLRRLQSKRYFVWIKRRVTPAQAAAVRRLELPGVRMSREARRYYPNRELAAHVLGFANIDGKGIEGLELKLEERLRGSSDRVPALRDRRGVVVFSEQLLDDRAARGDDVYLTLDKTIQRIAEKELELSVRTFEARAGSVVVLDPSNGEILALANYPSFNPNDPGSAPPAHRRNRAVTDRFEPGSTVKPFTVAGALATGAVRPDQAIDCENGALQIADDTIHDTHQWERLTPSDILKYSSNIGTAKIGMALGKAGLYRAFRRFGFGQPTGVPLPGETQGILRHYKRWYEMDAATISFGQGMSTTALQLAVATGALANRGRLMKTWLIKQLRGPSGESIEKALPVLRRRVVPKWSAQLVSDMLTSVTEEDGTALEASVDGYLVAGKTGTAQKADYVKGGYAKGKWTASFVGFVPARKPRIVVAVIIDEPIIAHYGGKVAGPAFRRIAAATLRHLGVPSARGGQALARHTATAKRAHAAKRTSRKARVVTPRTKDAEPGAVEQGPGRVRVPDVTGKTARQALVSAQAAELEPVLRGSGLVASQEPPAGSKASLGSVLTLQLLEPALESAPVAEPEPPADRAAAKAQPRPRKRVKRVARTKAKRARRKPGSTDARRPTRAERQSQETDVGKLARLAAERVVAEQVK